MGNVLLNLVVLFNYRLFKSVKVRTVFLVSRKYLKTRAAQACGFP
jgi:hypothetical protein